jgi:hypothetical protein
VFETIRGAAIIAALFVCMVWINCLFLSRAFAVSDTVSDCFCMTFKEYGKWLTPE